MDANTVTVWDGTTTVVRIRRRGPGGTSDVSSYDSRQSSSQCYDKSGSIGLRFYGEGRAMPALYLMNTMDGRIVLGTDL